MKKTTIHIIVILSILFVSCQNKMKTDNNTVVIKNDFKTKQIENSNKKQQQTEVKKLNNQISIHTLVIQNDTLFIENENFLNRKENYSKCRGKINGVDAFFIAKTNPNSGLLFLIGTNPKRNNENESKPTIILLKSNKIIDILELDTFVSPNYDMNLRNLSSIVLKDTDEIIEFNYYQPFGGGFNGSFYFFRKANSLIQGFEIEQGGETGSEYFYQNIIPTQNNEPNQIWVENKVGKDDLVYFKEIEKYQLNDSKLVRLNPKTENFYYVTAKNGLTQRSEPSMNGESLGKLDYKTKVSVLNRTDIEMTFNDAGKQISGHWVQIEYKGEQPYDHSFFVFDGYLSKNEPNE